MADALAETIESLLESHASEIAERDLLVRRELDPAWRVEPTSGAVAGIRQLLQLVFATLPDGCEVHLESARSAAPIARVGDGTLTLRWQVPGVERPASESGVIPLHPRAGDAEAHILSRASDRVRDAFVEAGWSFEIEAVSPGLELIARARPGPDPNRGAV